MMNKYTPTKVATVITLLLGSAIAQNGFAMDFNGYARAGISSTTNGGEQMCFGSGANGHYVGRLGDECDSYVELGLSQDFQQNDGVVFKVNTMFSGQTSPGAQYNDYQSLSEPGSTSGTTYRADWAMRQLNVEATGLLSFDRDATLWGGKKYYQRKDVHILDLYYLNNSGYGAGLEHLKAGIGDVSIAWLTGDQSPYSGKSNASGESTVQTERYDLRYSNIPVFEGTTLELAAIYGTTDLTENQDNAGEPSSDGVLLTSIINYKNTYVDNNFVIQYGSDAMADSAWKNSSGSKVTTYATWEGDLEHSMRVINYGDLSITDNVGVSYSLLISKAKTLSSSTDISEDAPYRYSAVVRPSYFWSPHTRTTLEMGHVSYKESYSTEEQRLNKIILAEEFTPDFGMKSRPTIRLYTGRFFGNVADQATTGSSDGEGDNYRFGAQVEAWW